MNLIHGLKRRIFGITRKYLKVAKAIHRPALLVFSLMAIIAVGFGPSHRISEFGNIGEFAARSGIFRNASASHTYANLAAANLTLQITTATANLITANDDWTGVLHVEGYMGKNLTATHGIDPQTVLGTEFTNGALPVVGQTQVNANKGNPSAFNAGGVTEFDSGTFLAIGFQGNVQANPYLVFFLNTLGTANVTISYDAKDIDAGSNNAVSPLALQYRLGETGPFTNLPDGFIADVSDGPNIAGRVTSKTVVLPSNASNQPQVQIRLITTNAANTSGSSTPDEWIGINNVVINAFRPTAASVRLGGSVRSFDGRPVSRAIVQMSDSAGNMRSVLTNPFGKFRFDGVLAGETYIFNVIHKRYTFTSNQQVYFASDDFSGLQFIGY